MPSTDPEAPIIKVSWVTLQNEETGELKRLVVRPCEACSVAIMHEPMLQAECHECGHMNCPVVSVG